MTEKELIIKAGEELDAKLAEAKKTGNLVVKDATEDEGVIRSTFEKGEGIFRLFPAFVPRRFGKAGRRLKLHPDDYFAFGMARGSLLRDGLHLPLRHRMVKQQKRMKVWLMFA